MFLHTSLRKKRQERAIVTEFLIDHKNLGADILRTRLLG